MSTREDATGGSGTATGEHADDPRATRPAERSVESEAARGPDDLLGRDDRNRKRALLAVLPFLFVGLFDLVLLLGWGLDPLWGFLILPPILFVCVLAWIAFSTGLAADRVRD